LSLAVIFSALAGALVAQQPASFRSNVELVTVPCTVVDANGAAVAGLTREDFRVFDNGVPRIVEHLWVDSEPLTLAVLIDASPSQQGQLDEHVQTARDLMQRILRTGDQSIIVAIGEEVREWPNLDARGGPLLGDQCPARVCGGSPLWNAVYDTARLKLGPVKGNKAILLLTDGFDTGSPHTFAAAAAEVQRAGSAIYAVQYPGALGTRYAPELLRLVAATAGATFSPGNVDQLVSRMEIDLRHRYVLGFRPERLSMKSQHDVRVEVTNPKLTVRARKMY
jgi:Ca-activated chloride channel family protein